MNLKWVPTKASPAASVVAVGKVIANPALESSKNVLPESAAVNVLAAVTFSLPPLKPPVKVVWPTKVVVLFTLTFLYVYRTEMNKNYLLYWGIALLFIMGLEIRAIMTLGRMLI